MFFLNKPTNSTIIISHTFNIITEISKAVKCSIKNIFYDNKIKGGQLHYLIHLVK